ncbi:MAG: hypothetical protein ACUVSX_05375 [Aggregatilineales bacterium]
MSPLTIKRIAVWLISIVLGSGTAYLIITVGFSLLPHINLPPIITPVQSRAITIAEYGNIYFLTTALPLTLLYMVWLDRFLDTRILPD